EGAAVGRDGWPRSGSSDAPTTPAEARLTWRRKRRRSEFMSEKRMAGGAGYHSGAARKLASRFLSQEKRPPESGRPRVACRRSRPRGPAPVVAVQFVMSN